MAPAALDPSSRRATDEGCPPPPPVTSPPHRDIANNRRELRRLGITHVLNASHSRWRGPPDAYEALGIRYLGVEAHDSPAFDMSTHFQAAADFIHRALRQPGGRREGTVAPAWTRVSGTRHTRPRHRVQGRKMLSEPFFYIKFRSTT